MPTKKPTAAKPVVKVVAPEVSIEYLLSIEGDVHELARSQGDYDNVDAVKHALKGIEQTIGALGNVIDTNRRLVVPA